MNIPRARMEKRAQLQKKARSRTLTEKGIKGANQLSPSRVPTCDPLPRRHLSPTLVKLVRGILGENPLFTVPFAVGCLPPVDPTEPMVLFVPLPPETAVLERSVP